MGILSARSVLSLAAMFGIFSAKFIRDKACRFILRHRADTSRVGTHIRNQTLYARTDVNPFIELLSHHHGLTSPEINLICGILLHRGSRIGQRSIASTLFLFDAVDYKVITLEVRKDVFDLVVVRQLHLFTIHTVEAGLKLTSSFLEGSVNRPVFFWFKGINFILPVDNQLECDRLHPTSRQAFFDFLPENRRNGITNQAIQNSASLLRIDQIHINLAWLFKSILDRIFGNFIEDDTVFLFLIQIQNVSQMPRNSFSFAIRVTCQKDLLSFLRFFFQVINQRTFTTNIDILRLIVILKINGHSRLFQVTNMTDTGQNLVVSSQIFFYCFCLSRRLYDDKIFLGRRLFLCFCYQFRHLL